MSDYRFTHLTGRVNYPRPRSPSPPCTGRTHLTASDIDADFFARKLLRNSAPSLCDVLDGPRNRARVHGDNDDKNDFSSTAVRPGRTGHSVLESGRYHGVSAMSPTTAVEDFNNRLACRSSVQGSPTAYHHSALDVNERYVTPSYSSGLESTLRPYSTTHSVDIRTRPGRPKVFRPLHVTPTVTGSSNSERRRIGQGFSPRVLDRCNTFGQAFERELFGPYRNVAMEKRFN